jgi:hypothetical protein
MASLLAPQDDEKGTDTNVSGGGSSGQTTPGTGDSTTPTGTGGGGTQNQQTSQAINNQTSNQQDVEQIGSLNQGVDFSPFINYVQGQGQTAKGAINQAKSDFDTSLGTFGTFGTKEQGQLGDVLGGKGDFDTGYNLIHQQYGGPQNFTRTYDPILQQYVSSANATGNEAGIQGLLQQWNPGLTQGERAFDAQTFLANPNYKQASQGLVTDAANMSQLGDTTATDARNAISQRQNDIAAFNTAGQNWVQQQRDAITNAINAQQAAGQQHSAQAQDALARLKAGTANFSDFDPSLFNFSGTAFNPQTVAVDQSKYMVPAGTMSPGMIFSNQAMSDVGFPGGYLQAPITNLMAPGAFSQTIDPRQYLQYANTPLTREAATTPEQAAQYNLAERLLDQYDMIKGTGGAGLPQISLNTAGMQQALAQAQAQRDAVAQQDADWLAGWSGGPQPIPGSKGGWMYQMPQGGIPVDATGRPLTQAEIDEANKPPAAATPAVTPYVPYYSGGTG